MPIERCDLVYKQSYGGFFVGDTVFIPASNHLFEFASNNMVQGTIVSAKTVRGRAERKWYKPLPRLKTDHVFVVKVGNKYHKCWHSKLFVNEGAVENSAPHKKK